MDALRWASFLLAVICLVCLGFTPNGPASFALAGFFFVAFVAHCWTYRGAAGDGAGR